MNRRARRAVEALSPAYERTIDSDRLFFRRHTTRSYRVRLATVVEIEENAGLGAVTDLIVGQRWHVAVRQVSPGFRCRLFFRDDTDRETDLSDADARAVWEWIETDESREIITTGAHLWRARR